LATSNDTTGNTEISVVAPVYNEEGNLRPLYNELQEVLDENYRYWEIVLVDDGSQDGSLEVMKNLHERDKRVKAVKFKANFGQTAALQAGVDNASGEVVVTMDSDMQNDPRDIPRLVNKLEEEDCDLVNGWRKERDDPLSKRLFSEIAAKMRRALLGTDLHDYGCTLKAFSKEAASELKINGEMHRYIPPILARRGYQNCEIVVNHRERHAGDTSYGWQRLPKGFMDLVNVWFWQKYEGRPLHIFGGLGIVSMGLGGLLGTYALYQKLFRGVGLSDTAATTIAPFLFMVGVQFFISGILADIVIKNHHQTKKQKNYNIDKVIE
jgi:glycosyltransferase involved in cell wall biosynthesis